MFIFRNWMENKEHYQEQCKSVLKEGGCVALNKEQKHGNAEFMG